MTGLRNLFKKDTKKSTSTSDNKTRLSWIIDNNVDFNEYQKQKREEYEQKQKEKLSTENNEINNEIPKNNGKTVYDPTTKTMMTPDEAAEVRQNSISKSQGQTQTAENNGEKAKWYDVIGTDLATGMANANASLFSGLTYFTGQKYSPFKKVSEYYDNQAELWEKQSQQKHESRDNDMLSKGSNLIAKAVGQAIPDTVFSIGTAGTTGAKRAADVANYGKTATQKAIETLSKSPSFWSSFVKEGGEQGNRALESGTNPFIAAMSAIGTGAANAAIETAGGIEGQVYELPTWKNWLRSAAEEGGEEVTQGAVSNLIAKLAYDNDAPLFSTEDENAVINPTRAAQEFAGGAIAGGIMSAPRTVAYSINSKLKNNTNTENITQRFDDVVNYLKSLSHQETDADYTDNINTSESGINNNTQSVVGGNTQWETPIDTSTYRQNTQISQAAEDIDSGNTENVVDVMHRYRMEDLKEPESAEDVIKRYENDVLKNKSTTTTSDTDENTAQEPKNDNFPKSENTFSDDETSGIADAMMSQRVMWKFGNAENEGTVIGKTKKGGTVFVKVKDDNGEVYEINPTFAKIIEPSGDDNVNINGVRAVWDTGITNGSGEVVGKTKSGQSDMYVIRTDSGRTVTVNSKYVTVQNDNTASAASENITAQNADSVSAEESYATSNDLQVGDIIDYKGKQWRVTQTGFNMSFENLDKNDSEQSFSYIGGVDNFNKTHDYNLISGDVLQKKTGSDTIKTKSSEVNENDTRTESIENDNGLDEIQTQKQAREVQKGIDRIDTGRRGIRQRNKNSFEKRTLYDVCQTENFERLKNFVGNEVSVTLSKELIKKYSNDTRLFDGENLYDVADLVAYDMLANADNSLRELFADNIAEYFNTSTDTTEDITGEKVSADILEATKNSVVKNENGQLIPVYHGTGTDFDVFRRGDVGIHFGSYSQAAQRVNDKGIKKTIYKKAYLNIENPLVVDEDFFGWNANQIAQKLNKMGVLTSDEAVKYIQNSGNDELVADLKRKGFDGVIYNNEFEVMNGKSYIVFDNEQIFTVNQTHEYSVVKDTDGNENNQDGSSVYGELEKMGLTYDEQRAILEYKSSGSYILNEALRNGQSLTKEERNSVDLINSALQKFPVYQGEVYRNLVFDWYGQKALNDFVAKHKQGEIICYNTLSSSSKNVDGYILNGDLLAHLTIQSKSGRDISNIGIEDESEVLFDTKTEFYVHDIQYDGKTANIILEERVANDLFRREGNTAVQNNRRNEHRVEENDGRFEDREKREEFFDSSDIIRGRGTATDRLSETESERNGRTGEESDVHNNRRNEQKNEFDGKNEGVVVRRLNADDNIKRYLDGKTNLQKGNISKELNKTFSTDEYGSITTAEFIQRSFDDGKALIENKNIKSSIVKAKNEFVFGRDIEKIFRKNSKKYHDIGVNNFAFAKEARELNITKQGGEHIKTIDPELYYYITGDESVLPESDYTKTYGIRQADGSYYEISKTAYEYGKWLNDARISDYEKNENAEYPHLYDESKVSKAYINAVDNELLSFIDKISNDFSDNKSTYIVGKTTNKLNKDIKELTEVDTTLFNHYIKANSIRHIMKDHGSNGFTDHSMADPKDIARIGYVINNYDDIELLDNESKEYRDKNQKPAKMIKLSKRIDGTYYVVEAVPDTKAKSLAVVSAYIKKAPAQQTENVQAFSSNVRNASVDTEVSDNIVSQDSGNVKNGAQKANNKDIKREEQSDVYNRVLERQSGNDNGIRESEPISEVKEGRDAEQKGGKSGKDVAFEDGTDIQPADAETSATKQHSGGNSDNGIRKSDNGNGNGGTGTGGNDNVDVKTNKANDFVILKAVADEIDTTAPNMSNNIKAIETLYDIEKSGKAPTKIQQRILAGFKGWGGLSDAFYGENKAKLQNIMSESEMSAAQSTVNDAYFTPTSIIDGIYKGLSHLGFEGGAVLEPSMGVGNFFGRMPKSLKNNSSLFGVEIDTISGRIARQLYPSADITIAPFQDTAYKDGVFDLIIGNVPFGEVKYKYKNSRYLIHDYFFVKAMDKLSDGGVLAFLTTKGTLDKLDSSARVELSKKGRMIAAYRLPSSVFSKSAGANVVTDLIIMQRTDNANGEKFVNSGNVSINGEDFSINEYFVNHPENIIGELTSRKDWRSGKKVLDVTATGNVAEQLAGRMKKLPKNLLGDVQTAGNVDVMENNAPIQTFITTESGNIEYIDAATGELKQIKGKSAKVAKEYINVKNAYQELVDATLNDKETNVIASKRSALNAAYDEFAKKYGTLKDNKKVLIADNDFYKISGLEVYDTKSKRTVKSEIFTKDTLGRKRIKSADNVLDALSISIGETGKVDMSRISKLSGMSEEEAVKELEDRVVYTPDGDYELNEVYLSGNVREKYEAVKGKKGFEKNEKMLKAVIPKDIPAKDITPQFGAPWIKADYVADFLKETFHLYSKPIVNYDPITGTWSISGNTWGDNTLMTNKYGTKYMDALKLAEKALNMRTIVVKKDKVTLVGETRAAQQKAEDIKNAFEEWCFKDSERRKDLVATFNKKFNSNRNMDFSELAKYLTFNGLTDTFKLRDYQKRAVARAVFNGNTLLAHGVGTGKTAEMIAIAMELKRMGIAKKNMMVVPSHKVSDFRNDILKMYPSAKVAYLEKGANAAQRQKFYALVASNDFDIVIIPHSSFGMLDVSADTKRAFINNQIAELEEVLTKAQEEKGKIDGRFIASLEKQKKRLGEKLKFVTESAKDNGNIFEELGIDSLFVDEAHNFKNLPFASKLSRVAGVSINQNNNKTRASRAENMFMITDYLNRNDGRIVFATATPITNSMSEIYNMMRFLRPDILEDAGLQSFDAWASMFGSIVNQAEVDPSGRNMRMKERFSKFKNVSQMIEQFRRMADILKTGDVIQELPKVERIDVYNKSNSVQEEFLDIIDKIIDDIRTNGQRADHNMLEVTTAGQMAAVDLRFVTSYFDGKYSFDELNMQNNRASQVAQKVYKEYIDSNSTKGTQFIFCDYGVHENPNAKYGFYLYGDLINRLVALGIPRSEIAIAQEFEDKADLSAKVNTGEIRVLIGTTAVMGEGMNAQQKAVALHHMTVPARPSDIEQREGRIIRYGNENKNVRIYRYIQERSYDSYQWQMQERKASFINQALSGGSVEELEEMSDFQLSAREAKAIASGNPLLLEKIEIEDKVNNIKSVRNKFNTDKLEMRDRLSVLPDKIAQKERAIVAASADMKIIKDNASADFEMTVGEVKYTERTKAADNLKKIIENAPHNGTRLKIGSYRGLELYYTSSFDKGTHYILKGNGEYSVLVGDSATGNITRIVNLAEKIGENVEIDKALVKNYKSEIETLKREINTEFPRAKELEELQLKLNDIDTQLGINVAAVDMSEVIVDDSDNDNTSETEHYSISSKYIKSDKQRSQSSKQQPTKSIQQIVNETSKRLNIPVGTGKITNRNADGVFKQHAKTIRLRIANDLPTFAHEIGHYFDDRYGFSTFKEIDEVVNDKKVADFLKNYPKEEHASEAFGEFIKAYLTNRDNARQTFPEMAAAFDTTIEHSKDKDIQVFKNTVQDTNNYMSSGVAEKMSAAILTRKDAEKMYKLSLKEKSEQSRMNWVDPYAPIERATKEAGKQFGKELKGNESAYELAVNSLNATSKTANILNKALVDMNGNEIGDSFFACLEKVKASDLNDFVQYLIARHAPSWLEEDMQVFSDEDLNDIQTMHDVAEKYETEHPEFKSAAEKLYRFQRQVVQAYLVDTGIMSASDAAKMQEKHPYYIPFIRVMEKGNNKAKSTFANQNIPIRRAHGSGLAIQNPLESIIMNTQKYVTTAMRNQTMQTLAKYADTVEGFGEFMEAVPPDMERRITDLRQQRNLFAESLDDLYADNSAEIMDLYDDILGDEVVTYTIGRQRMDIVSVLEDGKRRYFQVHDRNFLDAIAELTPKQINGFAVLTKLMNVTKVLQTGWNYKFGIKNPIRDYQTGYKNSIVNNPFEYAVLWGTSFFELLSRQQSEELNQYYGMGGGHSSELSANMKNIRDVVTQLKLKGKNQAAYFLYMAMHHPLKEIAAITDFGETVPRFAEFKAAKQRGLDNQHAIYLADRVTTNFKLAGKKARVANKFIMYFNPSVQGIDVFYRNIKNKPIQMIVKLLIPSILGTFVRELWNRYMDKEGWENLSQYTKNNNYCYALGDGKWLKIPKGREVSAFDSFAERVWDSIADGNKDLWWDFAAYAAENLLPNIVPTEWLGDDDKSLTGIFKSVAHETMGKTLAGPLFDIGFNKDYKGSPIVSEAVADLPKREQYNGRTSLLAVKLGEKFNISPLELDHLINSSTGAIGSGIANITAVDESERKPLSGIKNLFVADSNYSTDIINNAYSKRDKAVELYAYNPTVYNGMELEKDKVVTSYISGMLKSIKTLPYEQQSKARGDMFEKVKKMQNSSGIATDSVCDKFSDTLPSDFKLISLPSSVLERERNGETQIYQLSPDEYNQMVDEIIEGVEQVRKDNLSLYDDSDEAAEKTSEKASKRISNIKSKYKDKHSADFVAAN